MEGEKLSQREAKAVSKRIRRAGKEISNESMLAELRDRTAAIEQTKSQTKKARKQAENQRLYPPAQEPQEPQEAVELKETEISTPKPEIKKYKVWDYEDLMEDWRNFKKPFLLSQ